MLKFIEANRGLYDIIDGELDEGPHVGTLEIEGDEVWFNSRDTAYQFTIADLISIAEFSVSELKNLAERLARGNEANDRRLAEVIEEAKKGGKK